MRFRKLTALFGTAILLLGCVFLFMMMDLTLFPMSDEVTKDMHKDRLKQLEKEIAKNQKMVGEIKDAVQNLIQYKSIGATEVQQPQQITEKVIPHNSDNTCMLQSAFVPKPDIQMLSVYEEIKFDNPDGGVWKQGWNVQYNPSEWNEENKLKVFVVPHSHNDPGWIRTFEDYYRKQTKGILNYMVKKLNEHPGLKFIWAETSFLSLWWDDISPDIKIMVKQLIDDKQLEIVTGGWVMNDEANTHYFAMISQMIEGHEWLQTNLGTKPRNGWAIDPFGLSPTMAYLLKRMGFENMVIQRAHYSIKKYLAQGKNLEFRWRQIWDRTNSTDILCHLMPFYSYDVPHTCGPDPKICCQFDFKRLPGQGVSCPWRISPQVITKENVENRAKLLLDQYRKKAQLYRTNVVLVPLGDDFRYDTSAEWDVQYINYQRIFDHLNSNPHLNVEAQFGTLSDYFDAVRTEMEKSDGSQEQGFPSLTGDFFTYADRDDHYWSGYYTSRPFYKQMDRVLEAYLRAGEIIFAMAWGHGKSSFDVLFDSSTGLMDKMTIARRNLGLFQHHDGITGTARDHVVEDYAQRMLDSIEGLQHVIQQCAHFLLSPSQVDYNPDPENVYFDLDDKRKDFHSIPEKTFLNFDNMDSHKIVVYNPLTERRQEIITVIVSSSRVKVSDSSGNLIHSQINPFFTQAANMSDSQFELSFLAEVPSLALVTYVVEAFKPYEHHVMNSFGKVKVFNLVGVLHKAKEFDNSEILDSVQEFSIQNEHLQATFHGSGLLKSITLKESLETITVDIDFVRYGIKRGRESSGAYLFLPDGPASPVRIVSPLVCVIEGPLKSEVAVHLPNVVHKVTLYNSPGVTGYGLEISNFVDIRNKENYELAMRISTNIQNGNDFFTDLNGFQIIRRERFSKLPLQANYYPLPSAVYIEDGSVRMTLLSAQSRGVASLEEGQLEIMQDRRLSQDDNRGLGQGVLDNFPTNNIFRLLIEKREENCKRSTEEFAGGFLSFPAHSSLNSLLYPFLRLIWVGEPQHNLRTQFSPVAQEPGCDVHLVNLRLLNVPVDGAGLIVHRLEGDCCFPNSHTCSTFSNGQVAISDLFPELFGNSMKKSSLSFLHNGYTSEKSSSLSIPPMEMTAVILSR